LRGLFDARGGGNADAREKKATPRLTRGAAPYSYFFSLTFFSLILTVPLFVRPRRLTRVFIARVNRCVFGLVIARSKGEDHLGFGVGFEDQADAVARTHAGLPTRRAVGEIRGGSKVVTERRAADASGTVVDECLVGAAGLVAQARAGGQSRWHADSRDDREREARRHAG